MHFRITKENQSNWSDRVLDFSQRNQAEGREHFRGTRVPIGFFVEIQKSHIKVLRPEQNTGTCRKCGGTGIYHYGPNKSRSGSCHDCKGKGTMTVEDRVRDEAYHEINGQL